MPIRENDTTFVFNIKSFQSGINEQLAEGLLKMYEAVKCNNCDISNGSLSTFPEPTEWYKENGKIGNVLPFYNFTSSDLFLTVGTKLKKISGNNIYNVSGRFLDSVNFQYGDNRVLICTSASDIPFKYEAGNVKKLLNRRKKYDDEGNLVGYIDANGNEHSSESDITTYAPKGDFIELYYDRLWIAGDKDNPDRLYFSTTNTNGADIQDFTVPLAEEEEINMHGGFIDVRTYDGSKIIGLKKVFNSLVVFKEKSAHKVYGSSPSNYQMVDLFNSNGAIANRSICTGTNGCFFLNSDGIYYYDGTNTNLISQKIQKIIKRMNVNYANNSVGIYYDNKYYLAIPVDGSESNNLLIEYNVNLKSFTTYDVGDITQFLEWNNKLYIVSGSKILELFNGTKCLPLYWETPYFDFDSKNTRKLSNYIYFRASGEGKIRFELETERKTKILEVDITGEEKFYRKKLKNKGRMFKLRISNVDNSKFTLTAPQLFVEADED